MCQFGSSPGRVMTNLPRQHSPESSKGANPKTTPSTPTQSQTPVLAAVLYSDRASGSDPLPEAVAQDLFKAIAYSYCDANDLDITPEAETGKGQVDFKLSRGTDRAIVEVKKSTNGKPDRGVWHSNRELP